LELGGNDAAIVLGDADLDRAADAIVATGLSNGGAFCSGIKRVYVEASVADELEERVVQRCRVLVIGDPFDPAVTMGPIQNRVQFDRASALDADARASASGARGYDGALPPQGHFMRPTVFTGLGGSHPLVAEEQFAPLMPMARFEDVETAIAAANACIHGLGGSIWSRDRALGLAVRLEVGTAWTNQHGNLHARTPMPMAKQSGLGIDYGGFGVQEHGQLMLIHEGAYAA
jgi:acyl-CoA reductase-like NAD-dependent aldehyde dehydrogenase